MKVRWSDIAEADLDQLYDYIARDVPYYAEQFVDRLIDAVSSYRVIYLLGAEQVHILTVIHGSRDLAGQEKKPWEAV